MSYDAWKTHNPDDERLGRSNGKPEKYRCTVCCWSGWGITDASEHFWQTEHAVKPASDPRFRRPAKEAKTA